ncbi:MAG: 3-oxoacyl-[acyl-carrier-protein] synthase III C-terminal domain-containing protein [bacterium]|nr:3-oxoacyl-[acyl-carrier-protein] synthase III C-terminal domain-containing protein [bacterium]
MTDPKLLALHTGVPLRCFRQDDIADLYIALLAGQNGTRRERAIRTAMRYAGVETRYSVTEPTFYDQPRTTQQRNDRYMQEALPLATQIILGGLEGAGIAPAAIDSLVVVSCTGFNVPGLDLLLAHDLSLSPSLARTQVFGMGCYGAFPGIRRALDSARARPGRLSLVLCLELCTLHLQFDDSTESVVSTSLFADGGGMVVIGADAPESASSVGMPSFIDSETYCDYRTLDHMSFTVTDHGFRMYLSSYVPDVLAANIAAFVNRLLERNGLAHEQVRFWAIHPGSYRIVEYIQQQLSLSDEQAKYSFETLRDFGNMSSATVLFVLDRIVRDGEPNRGDYGVMMAFGPGLTMEAMLLRW